MPDVPDRPSDKKLARILITTQPTAVVEICAYITFLKAHLDRDRWQILIKPHPREASVPYLALLDNDFVILSQQSVYDLLAESDIHISIY